LSPTYDEVWENESSRAAGGILQESSTVHGMLWKEGSAFKVPMENEPFKITPFLTNLLLAPHT